MVEEIYRIKWRTFGEEIPEPHKMILVRRPNERLKDAQWHFVSSDRKKLFLHDMTRGHQLSRCNAWLWCYDTDIELD